MGVSQVLLVTVVALFACSDFAGVVEAYPIKRSAVTSTDTLTHGHSIVAGGRSLRVEQTTNVEDGDSEERVNLWTKISKPVKLKLWRWRGKSDDFVKSELGMKALSGAALKAHPNYRTYLNFKLGKWYRNEKLTTLGAWERLKLSDIPVDKLRSTDDYMIYVRYVNIFDDNAMRAVKAKRKTPPLVSTNFDSEASKLEMFERAWIWGVTKRSDDYVLTALGMKEVSEEEVLHHANFGYYYIYMKTSLEMTYLKG
ncbi:RxLR effector protein Avr1 [Phytophthora ramorum]|uniref:RxLR effector protein Avr1 n=1 Tax=Phytophthora ramorum TaxID=164328 RepID=UPI0030A73628|nr:RxLR effector protein Avr1 [Phytophthora ramorum]